MSHTSLRYVSLYPIDTAAIKWQRFPFSGIEKNGPYTLNRLLCLLMTVSYLCNICRATNLNIVKCQQIQITVVLNSRPFINGCFFFIVREYRSE